jgi:hypothetical protein
MLCWLSQSSLYAEFRNADCHCAIENKALPVPGMKKSGFLKNGSFILLIQLFFCDKKRKKTIWKKVFDRWGALTIKLFTAVTNSVS